MASETPVCDGDAVSARANLWRRRLLLVFIAFVGIPIGASVIYTFPAAQYDFYPRCFFYFFTGMHCPGCGATRCVGALLHGDLEQAVAYNALFVLALPLILLGLSCVAYDLWTGKRRRRGLLPNWALKILIVVLVGYFIARNINVEPFNRLAPHEIAR